ncbi:unnamed protein product, partial [Mesorhabditis belari]|uniref:Uncharacterized protein n=1 Tax=Mesorhabditis belari TaxID=2138241 RepID=A0AAF3EW70_9BILA
MNGWWWHPKKRVTTHPSEEDYRCCCGCCTSKCGFIFFTVVAILWYATFGIIYSLVMLVSGPIGWIKMACSICLVVCGILAIVKQQPIYMQIYWVVSWVANGIVLVINLIYLAILAYQANDAANKHMSDEFQTKAWSMFFAQIFGIVIQIAVAAWMLCITWSYYSYLRDRKLYEEQQGQQVNPNVVVYKTPASNNYPTHKQ